MNQSSRALFLVGVIVFLSVGLVGTYWLGNKFGYDKGYQTAQADIRRIQEEAAKIAIAEASKAANPFAAINPLEEVDANPFAKAKKLLNPFQ